TGIGYMPRKGKLVGSISENRLGGGRSSDGRHGRDRHAGVSERGGAAGRSDALEGSISVENEGTGGDVDRRGGAGDVGRRNGGTIGPGVGRALGVGKCDVVTAAQGIVDGGLGGISGPDGRGSLEVRGSAELGGNRCGTDRSRSKRERAESLARVDGAIDGGVSEDVL